MKRNEFKDENIMKINEMKEWAGNRIAKGVLGPIKAGVASNRIRKNMDAELNLNCGEKDKKWDKRNEMKRM